MQTTLNTVQLNPNTILAQALEILRDYGLADLTMRRIARSLDVAPGALYWHFSSKQALLGAIADHLLLDIPAIAPREETGLSPSAQMDQLQWDQLVELCVDIYQALTSLRDGAEITLAAMASGTLDRDVREELEALAGARGAVCFHFLLGAAMDVQAQQAVAAALGNSEDSTDFPSPEPQKIREQVELILESLRP